MLWPACTIDAVKCRHRDVDGRQFVPVLHTGSKNVAITPAVVVDTDAMHTFRCSKVSPTRAHAGGSVFVDAPNGKYFETHPKVGQSHEPGMLPSVLGAPFPEVHRQFKTCHVVEYEPKHGHAATVYPPGESHDNGQQENPDSPMVPQGARRRCELRACDGI